MNGYDDAYKRALVIIAERRRAAEYRSERRTAELLEAHPELLQLQRAVSEAGMRAVQAAARADSDGVRQYRADFETQDATYHDLLSYLGLTKNDLEPQYACPACQDTGYVGAVLCHCARDLARGMVSESLCTDMPLTESTFEAFSMSVYPDQAENGKPSPRAHMHSLLTFCRDYAALFSLDAPNLLFLGATGLGKTHLSLAITGVVVAAGYNVIYGSAQNFLNRIEREHFKPREEDADTLESLLACDLLVLDDLGAEFLTPFVTSTIYNIINTRMLRHRPTIISSNLSLAEIESRYSGRIASRFMGNYTMKRFAGNDVRQIRTFGRIDAT